MLWKQIELGSSNDKWLVWLVTQRKQLSALVLRNSIFVYDMTLVTKYQNTNNYIILPPDHEFLKAIENQ